MISQEMGQPADDDDAVALNSHFNRSLQSLAMGISQKWLCYWESVGQLALQLLGSIKNLDQ